MRLFLLLLSIFLIGAVEIQLSFAEEFSQGNSLSNELDFSSWFSDLDEKSIIISIIGGIVSGLFVKFFTKTKSEKTFQKNSETIYRDLFSHISHIDSYKQSIYKMWESHEYYDNSHTAMVFDPYVYKEIQRFRDLMWDEIKTLTLQKNSPYVILSEYLLLLQYALSAHSHLYNISSLENGVGIDKKSLEYHRYYAKKIIESFTNFVPKNFIRNWDVEFKKMGGSQFIVKPPLGLGDMITAHHNFRNEALYFDAQYTSIIELLEEIKDSNTNNDSDS